MNHAQMLLWLAELQQSDTQLGCIGCEKPLLAADHAILYMIQALQKVWQPTGIN